MDSIRIKNLRCLEDTQDITLKPLTVLVGANSSGKSSFLRVFPLFKQSVEVSTRGPLLWYGNEVDFGSFDTALKRGKDRIEFEFHYSKFPFYYVPALEDVPITVYFSIRSKDGRDYVDCLRVSFDGGVQSIEMTFHSGYTRTSLKINGDTVSSSERGIIRVDDSIWVIPSVRLTPPNENELSIDDSRYYNKKIISIISSAISENISSSKESALFKKYRYNFSNDNLKSLLNDIFGTVKNTPEWTEDLLTKLKKFFILQSLDDIIYFVNRSMWEEFENVSYVKPVRASAERYYRIQNLSVKELDSDGHNMAVYLYELFKDPARKESFQNWTYENFGFKVEPSVSEGHISLLITDTTDSNSDNMADMGFGYSQLLPIIIMLWSGAATQRTGLFGGTVKTIVIEQPELHLHPKMQAQFADALMSTINKLTESRIPVRFIIETHSKTLINRIGIGIAMKEYNKQDVSILLFEEGQDSTTKISTASYSDEGYLKNWPIGFFDAITY